MKKLKGLIAGLFLVGCTSGTTVEKLTAKQAKEMMDSQDVVIMDVREESEYNEGHIKDALLIPLGTIREGNEKLPAKNQTILIYCRSGNRSAKAAKKMIDLKYEHIYDFGGIIDWPYDIEK